MVELLWHQVVMIAQAQHSHVQSAQHVQELWQLAQHASTDSTVQHNVT